MTDNVTIFPKEKQKRAELNEHRLFSVSCPWCEETGCFTPVMRKDEHGASLIVGLLCCSAKCQGEYEFIVDNGYLGMSVPVTP